MSIGLSKPRAVALATVAGALTLGFTSGAFGTFSATTLSGHSCSAYGYFIGFGYGYDCTPNSSGGGGGSSNPVVTTVLTTSGTTIAPTVPPVVQVVATDINRTKYKTAIQNLIAKGIMNNAPRVYPTRAVTRGEFLKMLAIANGFTPVTSSYEFDDVPESNGMAQYIYFGVKMGWVNTKNTFFRPNAPITQGEVTKLINAIKGNATADTHAAFSPFITRGKAAQDIFEAFFGR
jgi:hypothetical protein